MKRRKELLSDKYIQCVQMKFNKKSSLQDLLMIYFNSKPLVQIQALNIEPQMTCEYDLEHSTSWKDDQLNEMYTTHSINLNWKILVKANSQTEILNVFISASKLKSRSSQLWILAKWSCWIISLLNWIHSKQSNKRNSMRTPLYLASQIWSTKLRNMLITLIKKI